MRSETARNGADIARIVGAIAMGLVLIGLLATVALLTFSVSVSGHSMEPTLHPGDRLEVDLLHRHDVHRFDLVAATEPGDPAHGGGAHIVKRVIGMPGDRVAIVGGETPGVLVQPAGQSVTYRVNNPTWTGRVGTATSPCCTPSGTSASEQAWATVPAGDYWLMGDNWGGSTDSRAFGFVPAANIDGTLSWRVQPWGRIGSVPSSARLVSTTGS